jgi:hypothetical protein
MKQAICFELHKDMTYEELIWYCELANEFNVLRLKQMYIKVEAPVYAKIKELTRTYNQVPRVLGIKFINKTYNDKRQAVRTGTDSAQ